MLGRIDLVYRIELIGILDQHLIEAHAVVVQIIGLNCGFELLDQRLGGRICLNACINGNQLVAGQSRNASFVHTQADNAQIPAVFSGGYDIGIIHLHRLSEGRVRMTGHDHVDASGHALTDMFNTCGGIYNHNLIFFKLEV